MERKSFFNPVVWKIENIPFLRVENETRTNYSVKIFYSYVFELLI